MGVDLREACRTDSYRVSAARSVAEGKIDRSRGAMRVGVAAWLAAAGLPGLALAQQPRRPPALTLFQNVRIFDGKSAALSAPSNVLVGQQDRSHFDGADCGRRRATRSSTAAAAR